MQDERLKKETRKKLLEQAKKEFAEKGFMKASLRTICKNAGVTTGALYFFFHDKEDLFTSLVNEPLQNINAILLMHYQAQKERVRGRNFRPTDFEESWEACGQILHEMYVYREEFLLLLTCAQGSRLEHIEDSFAAIEEKQNRILADAVTRRMNKPRLSDDVISWLSHMHVDVFIYIITHKETEQGALLYLEEIFPYLTSGWCGMFGLPVRP